MIRRLGHLGSALAHRFLPDPFTLALLLTLVAFLLGWALTPATPWAMLVHWRDGFWSLLAFSMQMAFILVSGHALALTPPVGRAMRRLAGRARSTAGAAALVAVVAMVAGLVNWGLGLVVGALFAREVARAGRRQGVRLHYPLVVAAGYSGMLIWHGGLSGSAPLQVATANHFLEARIGLVPVTETLLSGLNVAVGLALLVAVPVILARMAPGPAEIVEAPDRPPRVADDARAMAAAETPADRLNRSRLLGGGVAAAALIVLGARFAAEGPAALNLDTVNFLFLFAGLLLHGSTERYGQAVADGIRGTAGIVLQFPFYAGIMGMVAGSGLVDVVAGAFVHLASLGQAVGIPASASFPVLTFFSAGLVNLFVPSGGGQWAIQGPIMLEAGAQLGVPVARTVLAVSYGDEWTNMLQPFWALPLLGITGIRASDLLGYTTVLMVLVLPIYVLALALF